jgi:hypothetical protein
MLYIYLYLKMLYVSLNKYSAQNTYINIILRNIGLFFWNQLPFLNTKHTYFNNLFIHNKLKRKNYQFKK